MPDCKEASAQPARGLVRRPTTVDAFRTAHYPPGPGLDTWIQHFWTVDWDLRDREPVSSTVISFPAMHLTAEWGEAGETRHGQAMPATLVHGVVSRVFQVVLRGRGSVLGARFRPNGFAVWAGVDAASFTNRVVPAGSVLGPELSDLHTELAAIEDVEARVRRLRELLIRDRRSVPADGALDQLVRRMATDDSLVRVEQLAELTGWSMRTLQRRFRHGVGIGPKWVLARFRLQEAALAIETDPGVDLAGLAVRLGWYDQAHLTNDFKRMLGETPGEYARTASA